MHDLWPAMRCKHWCIWRAACLTESGMPPLLLSQESSQSFLCLVSHGFRVVAKDCGCESGCESCNQL